MTIFTTTGTAFKFVVAFFFRAHTHSHKFSFQKNVLVMLVFLGKKKHVLVPQERTYLSLKNDAGNLKHVRVGVSLCFSPNFQTCFGCEKMMQVVIAIFRPHVTGFF